VEKRKEEFSSKEERGAYISLKGGGNMGREEKKGGQKKMKDREVHATWR